MLYYSHINEDNRIERQLLQSFKCTTAVVVAGSGERVLALMDCVTCKRFAVVDINEEALFLLQLKLAVLVNATVETYLQFIGHEHETEEFRLSHFEEMKHFLPSDCRLYWEQRKRSIAKGILYAGQFENFLNRVRPVITTFLGHKFKHIFDHPYKQNVFSNWRWKLVAWMFSQTSVYKLLGNKDIAFTSKDAHTSNIPVALENIIYSGKAHSSFIAHLIFKGHLNDMAEEYLPASLQRKVLRSIQERLRTKDIVIDYYSKDLLAFTRVQLTTGSVFYSLSDILSFQDQKYLNELLEKIAVPGSIVVGRSFLRNRLTPLQLDELAMKYGKAVTYDDHDSTGMYQVFSVMA
jgi:S-adenosylmethionine:diacylglycerol 3-amino-3-carboxypropyl transferase